MQQADDPGSATTTRADADRREALLRAIVGVQSAFVANADAPTAFREMVRHLEGLTGAAGVLIAEVLDPDGPDATIRTLAVTDISWDADSARLYEETTGFGMLLPAGDSMLGEVVRSRAPVIHDKPFTSDRYGHYPPGHPPIVNYLGLPAVTGDRLSGIVALINRPVPFSHDDVEFLRPLVVTLAQLIESRRANDELVRERRENAVLSEVARQMMVGAVLTSATGVIRWINPALEELTGYSLVEMQGHRPIDLLLSPSADDAVRAQIDAAMTRGEGFTVEMPCQRRDGSEFWVEATAHPLIDPDDGTRSYVTLVMNIDERRRGMLLERERDQAEARTEAQARFLAAMSHELRTPLNAVVGFQHLLGETPLSERQEHLLGRASDAAALLLANISDVLDFSRLEADALQVEQVPTSIPRVLDEVCSAVEVLAVQKGLELRRMDSDGSAVEVLTDPVRLKQVLLNLLGNAVKFTESGFVALTTSSRSLGDSNLMLNFTVSDSGIGIDAERLAEVFEPFRQAETSTARQFGGTGLGLAICQRITAAMGGTIRLSSALGQGSTFDLEIPVAQLTQDDSPVESGASSTERVRLDGLSLLVAEDNDFNGEVIVDVLESAGASVTLVTDGQQAVDVLRSGRRFDVIVLDVQMPVMDGLTAARTMLEDGLDSGAPIVALTAGAQDDDRQQCLSAGMADVIMKPIEPAELLVSLLRWARAGNGT